MGVPGSQWMLSMTVTVPRNINTIIKWFTGQPLVLFSLWLFFDRCWLLFDADCLVLITRKWEIWFLCRRCWHYLLSDEGVSVVCQGIRKFPRMLDHVVTSGYLRWWQNCVTRNMDCVSLDHWAGHHLGLESHPDPETCNYWTLRMVLTSNLRSGTSRPSW